MDNDFSHAYRELEKQHWWFRARREILKTFIQNLQLPEHSVVIEIGVGSGENLYTIYPGHYQLYGIEPFPRNAEYANERGEVPVYTGTAEAWPDELENHRIDMICMFDVLEHLEHDSAALKYMYEKLQPGGYLLLSVPAYQWLWGRQDEISHHYRRYTRSSLLKKIQNAGFTPDHATYFNSILFPAIALQRMLQKLTGAEGSDFDQRFGKAEKLFYRLFQSEKHLLPFMSFPFGVSIFMAAKKTN